MEERLISVLVLLLVFWCASVFTQDDGNYVRKPPSITEPLAPDYRFFKAGDDVTLKCAATGVPQPTYEWRLNEAKIENSMYIGFDAVSGVLTIPSLSEREEGFFNCRASSRFPNGQIAVAISPKIEVRVARVEDFKPRDPQTLQTTVGDYFRMLCDNRPISYGPTTFKWYVVGSGNENKEINPDSRRFIDQEGTLHFAYVLQSDEIVDGLRVYRCALSNNIMRIIKLGNDNSMRIESRPNIPEKPPRLEYHTTGTALTFKRTMDATLECVFSGYETPGNVPLITWYDDAGHEIRSGGRYQISNGGYTLTIEKVDEPDERLYECRGANRLGNDRGQMTLNVTSVPIWVRPLESQTVPEGFDAHFTCLARSAVSETSPGPPEWFLNGQHMGSATDPTKYRFNANRTELTVTHVKKDSDIVCFQCEVSNSVGSVFDDGCLAVILPIKITTQPESLDQVVKKGDVVQLTVLATTDPSVSVNYRWIFNNVTYDKGTAPPFVTYDPVTKEAFINTSELSDGDYSKIDGIYRCEAYHQYQIVPVEIRVTRQEDPPVVAVVQAGFDYWIIGLIIGLLLILIVIIIIICVICRRKMLEGTYPVDSKEKGAGLDPERELKDSGFHDLSRADYDDYPDEKKPPRNFDFDEIPIGEGDDESFSEYGEEATHFNEDGSFIGVYSKDKKPPPLNPSESNV